VILNRWWLLALAAAVAAGIWLGQALLALTGVLGLLLGVSQSVWLRFCLTGVEYERRLDRSHAFWGETVTLTIRLSNRKILPLTWLRAEDRVPHQLHVERADVVPVGDSFFLFLRILLPMLPYEQVLKRYTVHCRHRGLFEFGPGRVESGDLFGYSGRGMRHGRVDRLVVYPKLFELHLAAGDSRRIVGPRAVDRVILTDPSRTVGVRRYQAGDPLRHLEWRASARCRELMVRVFEPTTDLALAIFLNFRVPGFGRDTYDPPELEFAISLAASLARWALGRRIAVGLFGDGARGPMRTIQMPISRDPEHLRRILEALAVATPFTRASIGQVLASEAPRLPVEASAVLVTASLDEALLTALDGVRRHRPLTVLFIGAPGAPDVRIAGLPIITVPYDPSWHELDRLHLAA
jgi:uncharacterized protein (DUF58 family)